MDHRLFYACVLDNYVDFMELVRQNERMLDEQVEITLDTPLHLVCRFGCVEIAREIVRRRPCMAFSLNRRQQSPMHMAVEYNQDYIVNAFLGNEHRYLYCQRDGQGLEPIHHMASKGQENMLFAILRSWPNSAASLTDEGRNVLHLCVVHEHGDFMIDLIRGFDLVRQLIQQRDNHGDTVLDLANNLNMRPELLEELQRLANDMEDDMEPDERLNEPTTTTKVFALTFTMVLMKFVAEEGIFEIIIDDAKLIVAVGWVIVIFSCLVQTVRAMNTLLWMSRYALNLGSILILTAVFLYFKNNLLTDYGISS